MSGEKIEKHPSDVRKDLEPAVNKAVTSDAADAGLSEDELDSVSGGLGATAVHVVAHNTGP